MKTKQKAWFNLILYLLTLVVNTLGSLGFINGLSQKEVSDSYPTLITPSPFTFSIWGLIYVLVLLSLIYMLVKHQVKRTAKLIEKISYPFWIVCVFNALWIVTFSYKMIGLSTLLIGIYLIALTVISKSLTTPVGVGEKMNAVAFGLFNGWLIIATVLNISAFLVQIKWNGFGLAESTWAIIILIAAAFITLLVQFSLRNAVLTLPLAWAYYGIWQIHQPLGKYMGKYPGVAMTAIVIASLYVLGSVIVFIMNGRCILPRKLEDKPTY